MNIEKITLEAAEAGKLLNMASGDAALLYLYLRCGNAAHKAAEELHMSQKQRECAQAMLRQLGLLEETRATFVPGERPAYSETDVLQAMDTDTDFRSLYSEVQRLLGRQLNTEELKILLGFTRYLGLGGDVISLLICFCKERSRQRGQLRSPSLRTIEKEAYAWAEQGIDTMERAAAYIRSWNVRNSAIGKLKQLLQIRDRSLTPGEERYAASWLEMGFDMDALAMAYERTCINTGGLNWAYMNKILLRWHESGLHTAQDIRTGDRKPKVPKGASGQLGQAELEAIARVMQEG